MGDVIGHTLDLVHQTLDFIDHSVDYPDQSVEIPAFPSERQAFTQIAIDDAFDCQRHAVDAAQRGRADNHSTRQSDH